MSDDEDNHATSGSIASTAELGVSEASLELAERVALRLDIYDKPAIFNMLSNRAKLGAGIVTVSFLFWWLLISNSSATLNAASRGKSLTPSTSSSLSLGSTITVSQTSLNLSSPHSAFCLLTAPSDTNG